MAKNLFEKPQYDEGAPAAPQATDEDRADPALAGLTDEEIVGAKTPAGGNLFDKPVYEMQQTPEAPVEKPSFLQAVGERTSDLGVAAAKGLGGVFNDLAGSIGTVAAGIPVAIDKAVSAMKGQQSTEFQDSWFREFVDPSVTTQPAFALKEDASFGEKATHALAATAGVISQLVLTAGEAAPELAANVTAGAAAKQAVAHGVKAMTVPAVSEAVNTGREVYQQTGDAEQAVKAAQTKYLTTAVSGILPLSAPGGLGTRLGTGFASGAVTGEFSRQAQNLANPASMQQPFSAEDTLVGGMTGSLTAGVMGPRGAAETAQPSPLDAIKDVRSVAPTRSAVEQAQHEASRRMADMGGDALDQELAGALAAAHASSHHAEAFDLMKQQVEEADKDYEQGMAQQEEDAARVQQQKAAGERYEAEVTRQAQDQEAGSAADGFQKAEADKDADFGRALAQREMQSAELPAEGPAETNLGEAGLKNLFEIPIHEEEARPQNLAERRAQKLTPEQIARSPEAEPTTKRPPGPPDGRSGQKVLDPDKLAAKKAVRMEAVSARGAEKTAEFEPSKPAIQAAKTLPAPKVAQIEVSTEGVARQVTEGELSQRKPANGLTLRREAVREERTRLPVKETNRVEQEAHEAASSPRNDLPEPSIEQSFAGNFKMGHTKVQGLDVTVEYPKGSKRPWRNEQTGREGANEMPAEYGYFKGTKGADGQHVDVLVGDQPENPRSFVVDHLDKTGQFEQHKVLMGFPNQLSAVKAFKKAYPERQVGPIKEMNTGELKTWLKEGDTTKPLQPEKLPKVDRTGKKQLRYAEKDDPLYVAPATPNEVSSVEPHSSELLTDFHAHADEALNAIDSAKLNQQDTLRVRRDKNRIAAMKKEAGENKAAFTPERAREMHRKLASVTGTDRTPQSLKPEVKAREASPPVVSVEKAKEALTDLNKEAPGIAPEVLSHPENAPDGIRSQMLKDGQMDARGVYDPETDTVYVFAHNHDSIEQVTRTAVHEGVAHKGLRKLLGDNFDSVMKDVYEKAADRDWVDDFIEQHGMDTNNEVHQGIAAEEYAASIAEQEGADPSLLRRIIDVIRTGLRKMGASLKWTDNDIRALLRKSKSGLGKVSLHAPKGVARLRYASKDYGKENRLPDTHPLSVYVKQGATVEEQADYNPGFVKSRLDALRSFADRSKESLFSVVSRDKLPDFMSPSKMPSMRKYLREAERMDGRRNELLTEADKVAEPWIKFASRDRPNNKVLMDTMNASTLAGVDPSKPYEPLYSGVRTVKGVETKTSLTDEQSQTERMRTEQWNRLRKIWDKLPAEAKLIYTQVRDSYANDHRRVWEGLESRINASDADGNSKQSLLAELRAKFESGRVKGPYFPLARFGDLWGVAKDKESGEVVSFSRFKTLGQQEAWFQNMGKDYKVNGGRKLLSNDKMVKSIDPGFVAKITDLANEVDPELAGQIWQHYLRTLPELSMRKHMINRKGRLGFTSDTLQAFGYQKFHAAHQIAKLEYMHKLEGFLDQMHVEASGLEHESTSRHGALKGDAAWAMPLYQEFLERHSWARNPKASPWSVRLASLGFVYHLVSPSAWLVNLSQSAMVAFPALGGHFNMTGAGIEMTRAAKQFAGARGGLANRLRGDERAAFDKAEISGLFGKTQAHALAGIGEEGTDYGSKRRTIMNYMSWGQHVTEKFNRETTFLAAYRLARKKGETVDTAFETAKELTDASHFNYTNANRPPIMQGEWAKVLLLFRSYSQQMTYRMARDFRNGVIRLGKTPEERHGAATRFVGLLGQTFLAAGATGMPMWWLAKAIINTVFGDEDKPFDAEAALRDHMIEHHGEKAAQALLDGSLSVATGAALTSRVGLNNLWWQSPPEGMEGAKLGMFYAEQALGPVFGTGLAILDASVLAAKGDVGRAAEGAIPKGGADVLKALRYAREGVTNLRGETVLPAEDLSKYDVFLQSLGFQPEKVRFQQSINRSVLDEAGQISRRKKFLKDRLFLAVSSDDVQGASEAWDAVLKFNEGKNPAEAIDAASISASAKARSRYTNEAVNGVHVEPSLRYLYDKHHVDSKERKRTKEEDNK